MTDARSELLGFLRTQLVGPVGDADELLTDPPTARYALGAIYPSGVTTDSALKDEESDERGGGDTDEGQAGPPDDPVALSSQWMPASVGLSVLIAGEALTVDLAAAHYSRTRRDGGAHAGWQREPLATAERPERHILKAPDNLRITRTPALHGRAELVVVWRPALGGRLATVTLVNAAEDVSETTSGRTEAALFQVHVRVSPGGETRIVDYPRPSVISLDEEDQELELQYRDQRTFGVGHGCSVAWDHPSPEGTSWVETAWIPTHETPNLLPRESGRDVLQLGELAGAADASSLAERLRTLTDDYRSWIASSVRRVQPAPGLEPALQRILARVDEALARIEEGIRVLEDDPTVFRAFQLSNRALRESMRRGRGVADTRRNRDVGEPNDVVDGTREPSWYPFQLAFQLAVLPSLAETGHTHRDIVDLLWFPTGGGKTEAYLGLSAMAIFMRRLGGAGAGTTVLTRYTLRLLTTQQFQRSATLICACEMVRRTETDLGSEPIRLGLWIGGSSTPNKCSDAREKMLELKEDDRPVSPFALDGCPWCATRLVPTMHSDDGDDYGFDAEQPNDFRIYCPSADCPFHDRIPVQVVDEVLYREPAEFVVATVDKFAQLAYRREAGALLGVGVPGGGPSLIIQDELHLLSGPLGTMVGLYEAALQEVIRHSGGRPKVVASTATIRRAASQARGLFGRDVRVFPPPGASASDSYFAVHDTSSPGRLYAGVMSQVHTPSFTVVQTAAALMQGRDEVIEEGDPAHDAYGTLVAYHNSLRELGKAITFARDDIPSRMEVYASSAESRRSLQPDAVVELTSNVSDRELTSTLARLNQPSESADGVAFVASTNMVSVGVDVPRLGLMLVNGQPKTTSEYIQATSRVGRGAVPGLVVTLCSPAKPRDRSHYEQFVTYHQSLYRWVEPTSVTPFALPARNRALHAALVILVRHVLDLRDDQDAARFTSGLAGLRGVVDHLVEHVRRVDPDEADATERDLWRLIADWETRAQSSGGRLRYHARSGQFEDLMKDFGATGLGWATPNSMRNVDRECLVKVSGGS